MMRDITMIVAVMASLVSVSFGVYKNIEANNAKGFAYQQAYQILNEVQQAPISAGLKASILESALGVIGTPPPVIDVGRSSADIGADQSACSAPQRLSCMNLAEQLGVANSMRQGTSMIISDMMTNQCFACFSD